MRYLLFVVVLMLMGCRVDFGAELPMVEELTRVDATLTIEPEIVETIDEEPVPSPVPNRGMLLEYQPFERGFMVWDVIRLCAYAYQYAEGGKIITPDSLEKEYTSGNSYTYCLPVPENPKSEGGLIVLEGLQVPQDGFGDIWNSYPEVREGIGFATDDPVRYTGFVPHEGSAISVVCCNVAALPDGRVLYCGMYGHSAGYCHVPEEEVDSVK